MSYNEEILQKAGTVLTEEITISLVNGEIVDLVNFVVELNLYEDIFSPCLTGNLTIVDSANLISELPILGIEFITIKYRTPTFENIPSNVIEKTFQLYSIENRSLNGDRETIYTMNFISVEGFIDQVETLVRSFSGTTDEIVSKIYNDYIVKDRRIDTPDKKTSLVIFDTPHTSRLRYISNYWSPFKNLSFIGKRVKGNTLNSSDYFFYESNKGFYFTSIEGLITQQLATGHFEEYVIEVQKNTTPRRTSGILYKGVNVPPDMTRLKNIKMPKTVDAIEGIMSGYHSNSIRGYDLTTKKMTESTFDFRKQNAAFVKTDAGIAFPNVPSNPYAYSQFVTYNSNLYNDYGVTDHLEGLPAGHPAQYVTDRIHYRTSYINSFNNFKFEIEIHGRTDIEVGMLIQILYPSARTKIENENTPEQAYDQLLSGSYLITAIHHTFKFGEHSILAEVVKNGLNKSLGENSE